MYIKIYLYTYYKYINVIKLQNKNLESKGKICKQKINKIHQLNNY